MANDLPDMKMETCLVWGKQDTVTPPEVAHDFDKLMPNSELFWIDKCGHAPMTEHPDQFNKILKTLPLSFTTSNKSSTIASVDYQKILEDQILRLNYRAFKQIAVLGSSAYQPFMQMRPRHRREVVEEILDIRVLTHMDILTRNQQTDLVKQIIEARHQCDLIES